MGWGMGTDIAKRRWHREWPAFLNWGLATAAGIGLGKAAPLGVGTLQPTLP